MPATLMQCDKREQFQHDYFINQICASDKYFDDIFSVTALLVVCFRR